MKNPFRIRYRIEQDQERTDFYWRSCSFKPEDRFSVLYKEWWFFEWHYIRWGLESLDEAKQVIEKDKAKRANSKQRKKPVTVYKE